MLRPAIVAMALAIVAAPATAQQHPPQHQPAPAAAQPQDSTARHANPAYAGMRNRDIKALDSATVAGYRAGEGMGMALAAELNRYPGPRHVLQLADSLHLTEEQQLRIGAAMDMMRTQAIRLGERIIERERELDRAFADRSITERRLRRMTEEIGRLQGALRAVHLAAHLATTHELTPLQIAKYERLRGYTASGHEHDH